jgi:hypothetical protein
MLLPLPLNFFFLSLFMRELLISHFLMRRENRGKTLIQSFTYCLKRFYIIAGVLIFHVLMTNGCSGKMEPFFQVRNY